MKSPAVDQEVPQEQDSREPTEVLQTVVAGGAEDDTLSVVDEAVSDAMDSDFGAGIDPEGKQQVGDGAAGFGETMNQLALSSTEATVLRQSFDMVLAALGNDREALGDAIYGLKIHALVAIKENFTTPRAVVSLRFFNCFRLLLEKAEDPNELKIYVETLAFKHLNNEITEQRVEAVQDAFNELMVQNVPNLPPGTAAAWRKLLSYTGSCYRYVGDTYGERLRVIKEDWAAVQKSATDDRNKDETKTNAGDNANAGGGDNVNADEAKEDDTADAGAETFSFGRMCAFSNEVMGQKTEGWMLELLEVFHILVDMISSPVHLQEECDLLAINLITKSNSIDFDKFKPVMLAALRSLLPKQWSTLHETSWEWLWTTVARNLNESTMKVRAFKPYNIRMFSSLQEEQLDRFRKDIFTEFFARSQASQDLFKQSQTRLRYIADRVLQSSSDMFQKNKDETLDDLSALGLRHVGYGIPIELFGPFVEVCVQVMHPLIQEFPNDVESTKLIWCPKDRAHQIPENEMPEHMMIEGFRWSIGLTARVLVRTIMDGSTAVMQAVHFDDSKRLRRALMDAPRVERCVWQLAVQVGSQSISPLFWALRSGAHDTAKTMIEDVLTIRADRDNYYFGADELFKYQPNIADNVLREAPFLAETLLDGLIWRSHKSKDNLRPVIYYLKHLLQDMDETKMLSRALISYIRFDHPQTIMHPILAFSLDMLWDKLALRYFIMDRILTIFNCFIFIIAECILNHPDLLEDATFSKVLAAARILVYTVGFLRLLYWHVSQTFIAYRSKALVKGCGLWLPQYLTRGAAKISLLLCLTMLAMMTVEPMFHCLGSSEEVFSFRCDAWTDQMSLYYEILVTVGVFLYVTLMLELGSISIKLSEYRVLVLHAIEQVILCLGVVFLIICTFAVAISGMEREVAAVTGAEWSDLGSRMSTLIRLAFGAMDLGTIQGLAEQSPLLLIVILLFMMMVYSFFFNLLVSQFCGVYTSLAADIKGHARLARGEIIIETFKAVKMTRWTKFMTALKLDEKVDFEEGDIGLAGGIKNFEPALAHPVAKDQIVRFGGQTDGFLPWPEKMAAETDNIERTFQKTIQKSLHKMLGSSGKKGGASTISTGLNSDHDTKLGFVKLIQRAEMLCWDRAAATTAVTRRMIEQIGCEGVAAAHRKIWVDLFEEQDSREPTEVLQTVAAGGADDETLSVVDEAVSDALDSDFGAGIDPEGQLGSSTEATVLRKSFDMVLAALGNDREDGVPIFDGNSELYAPFRRAALNYVETLEWKKRSLAGPRLQAALEGSARVAVQHKTPGWISHQEGATMLLDFLKTKVQAPTLAEAGKMISRFFYTIKRRKGESMNACGWFVTMSLEDHLSSREHHSDAPFDEDGRLREEISHPGDGQESEWSWRHDQWQNCMTKYDVSSAASSEADRFLPDFVVAWILLQRSGLDSTERGTIIASLRNIFTTDNVKKALKLAWPEDDLRRRDQNRGTALALDEDDSKDILLQQDEEESDSEFFGLPSDEEKGEYGLLCSDVDHALQVFHQAKRTLKDARERQSTYLKNRQFYPIKRDGALCKGVQKPNATAVTANIDDTETTDSRCIRLWFWKGTPARAEQGDGKKKLEKAVEHEKGEPEKGYKPEQGSVQLKPEKGCRSQLGLSLGKAAVPSSSLKKQVFEKSAQMRGSRLAQWLVQKSGLVVTSEAIYPVVPDAKYDVSSAASSEADRFLPDFAVAWMLLQRSGLDSAERGTIIANLRNIFTTDNAKKALKLAWPEDDLRRRDQNRGTALALDEDGSKDVLLQQDEEESDFCMASSAVTWVEEVEEPIVKKPAKALAASKDKLLLFKKSLEKASPSSQLTATLEELNSLERRLGSRKVHWMDALSASPKEGLAELKEHQTCPETSYKAAVKELNAVSHRKDSLRQYLQDRNVKMTGNETIPQLLGLGLLMIGEKIPGHSEDSLDFGSHANKTYGMMKGASYAEWVITTYHESGGHEGTSNWRLKRFAEWLINVSHPTPKTAAPVTPKKTAGKIQVSSPDITSDSSFSKVSMTKKKGSTAKSIPVPPRSEEEEMLSDNEIKIQGLESQLQAVKGASKREKRHPTCEIWKDIKQIQTKFRWSEWEQSELDVVSPVYWVSSKITRVVDHVPGVLVSDSKNVFDWLNQTMLTLRGAEKRNDLETLCLKEENFTTPRAVVSLRFFNCFRLLLEKAEDPNELKIYVETLAFKHLNNEITEQRVDAVLDAFHELMVQNVPNLPPGTAAAWRKLLSYTGSCYRYVGDTYGERLRVIKEDWAAVQKSATDDRNKDETKTNAGDNANAGGGENANADEAKEDDTADAGAETFSFGRMCAFSNEVMGQKTEGVRLIGDQLDYQVQRALALGVSRAVENWDRQLDRFRKDIFTEFFARSQASQDLFKQCGMVLVVPKTEEFGYGIPIELFGPFVEVCVQVMHPLIQEFPNDVESTKLIWCPKDRAHQIPENEMPEHMMIEGFRWSIGLTARVLVRTIMDGSTAVMQAIHFDDSKRLRRALADAPRVERFVWQLAVQVGSQSISPLFWALRSGAHDTAKTMIEDVLTIRADRDNYYYGADELFKYQPNIADNVLREAPFLAETLLDGLIWRSHKSKDNLRPVIYYLKHLLQDMDETKMLSRALISYIRFDHPQTIMHPILAFSLDLLWDKLALRYFIMDRVLTIFNCFMFIVAECFLNHPDMLVDPTASKILAAARFLVYTVGFLRLLYWHISQTFIAYRSKALVKGCGLWLPQYLTRGAAKISLLLCLTMLAMMTARKLRGMEFACVAVGVFSFRCDGWTDQMSLAYEILVTFGVFLYVTLILEMGSISIKLSEYGVLVTHAIQQVILCLGVVFLIIFTFAVAISGMEREVAAVTGADAWFVEGRSALRFVGLAPAQFCGVYTSLAADIKGHARLARGEIIIETFKAVKMTRWAKFMNSLNLDEKVDFEEGDIGIKNFEPALAHPVAKESLIQKSLHKMLGSGKKGGAGSVSTGLNSDQDTKLGSVSEVVFELRQSATTLGLNGISTRIRADDGASRQHEIKSLRAFVSSADQEREKTEMRPLEEADELASEASEAAVEDERRDTDFDNLDDDVGSKAPSSAGQNSNFGETMRNLTLSSTEVNVLRQSFDMLLGAMGHDREAVGDAIYGTKIQALVAIKDSFTTPRAVVSLRFFNCFRLLLEKADNENELKIYVETLAFKHLGNEILERRVEAFTEAFIELLTVNVPNLPPGTAAAWRQMLSYCGSCYKFVGDTYGERLRVIKEDWAAVQKSASEDHGEDEEAEEGGEEGEKGEKVEKGAETFSFGRMCAFSNEVMGQKTEGWMEELLSVFHILVEMISSPVHLQEECDLLAINLIVRSQSIDFEKFKPVMLAALRSLLPKQWSTLHETAWEWLWMTVSRNLRESTMKVRAFKPYNVKLFSALSEEQLDRFRKDIFTHFFVRAPASQDLFKQSQTRLRYIADRVLQSSADMFQKNKDETLDDLSALGLRHVGYGIPIELFGPFAETCVDVMQPLIQEFPNDNKSEKLMWCPKDKAHQIPEREVPEHMMVEGFRWSIGLTARVLVRTIMDGSTAVMQAIHFDDSKRLRRALVDAPRVERSVWQLAVQVGSQSISPLFWALRSGAHDAAKTMIQDILTIRADRDNYYYGADEMFKYQPNIADNILREAPFLAESLLDGLIWRSHKSQDNLRPVIYYLKHLLQDMDESKMLSRALISYIRFNHPQTIMHPILAFSLDLLWEKLALRYFLMDRILTIVNCIIFVIAECYMNQPAFLDDPSSRSMVVVGRILVYTLGFLRLLYWHICQIFLAYRFGAVVKIQRLNFPAYLMRGSDILSFLLMMDLLAMNTVEPIMHCIAAQEGHILRCPAWTDEMSLLYEIFVIIAVFLYVILIVEVGSVSIKLSEYRVLCLHAIEQVLLCFGVVLLTILTFAFAISGMTREMMHLTSLTEWADVGTIISTLIRLSFGAMDIGSIQHVAEDSPLLIVVIILFMMMVYTFFFNLLVSQFCGVYTSLAADIKGHARLARGEIIIETFKAVKLTRWQKFMNALHLDQKVDFEQGDIGLAGGIKTFEPALAHPVAKDQIIRFGGRTESHLPWPEKIEGTVDTIERTIQKTIQKTLHKYLGSGKKGGNGGMSTFSTNTGASETDASSHQGGEKASVHSSDHDHHSE
ncbi:Retrovirus-related Pol polyprotein from transposon TNT 1-94 [Durusdinium trenchii]|uniref:Retrovirus-related Pol polyprotein from transposon TNT 1-94 n=1 Tax=Durusdinium trenchii TaxID=1381693 RepID=A0ABP0RQD7_9DINO